ncbi:MAG: hypothetical protein WD851_24975 [Pirellulales bacterium]
MITTIRAHFDGKHALVLDEPVDLPVGTPLRIHVETLAQRANQTTDQRLPLTMDVEAVRAIVSDPRQAWRPLDVDIDPELGRAIAENPEFNIEEA